MAATRDSAKTGSELAILLDRIQQDREAAPGLLERFTRIYAGAAPEERRAFFAGIVAAMEVSPSEVEPTLRRALEASSSASDPIAWSRLVTDVRRRLESPRLRAFRRFLNVPGGLRFLLDLRADVLEAQREARVLEPLDEEIAHLLDTWFHGGFLFLREITSDSPFRQIRFLKEHELVHPMTGLEEMASRLGEDRRCFALYHLAIPEEPVVFIEVALVRGMARSIDALLAGEGSARRRGPAPDTAIFYSINNAQNGLAGLGLGRVLISRVVEAIRADRPGIRTMATLSPMPGFRARYLEPLVREPAERFEWDRERALELFGKAARGELTDRCAALLGETTGSFTGNLLRLLSDPRWIEDAACRRLLQRPLTALGYQYLTSEQNARGKPLDPVAGFHLGNGARLAPGDVNFAANRTPRGLAESYGLMANYVYSRSWLHQIGGRMRALLPWRG